jgi:hypothetical protein
MKKHADPTANPTAIQRSHTARVAGAGATESAWPITRALPRRGGASGHHSNRLVDACII